MFKEVTNQPLQKQEEEVLAFWQKNQIFEESVKKREGSPRFSFYDGPPFATGLPHYGHLLAGTIKDVVLRYKTMRGYFVPRRFGWDCHGLPVENEIEKSFGLSGSKSIDSFGIANFNEECRKIVLRYTEEWKKTVNRMGRWVDFSQTYKTMDPNFMESVWWVFSKLYEMGLVYKGYKVMPYSAKLGTALSNFEAGENYKDVDDPAITVAFKTDDNTYILAWTTTPWTLISNLALMVGSDIDYAQVLYKEKYYYVAESRVEATFKEDYQIVKVLPGKELVGMRYEPIFPYFKERAASGAFRVIAEDSVSTLEGTGIVHSAPAFGEVDFLACKRAGIEHVAPVDSNGQFLETIPEYAGKFVKDADKEIIAVLKKQGHLFHQATIRHRYPFCWRSDTPLIYLTVSSWFVAVEKIKDKIIAANQEINWIPSHIKEGRFGKWLEGARDWSISRSRYFGTPIPLWQSEDGDIKVIGSIQELEKLTDSKITDLHRHFIDHLTFTIEGKLYKRIPEVFDCWFESGSMPYAQNHYPFENKALVEESFPADFIAEGADQTRGWFYTLTVLSAALFNKPAFKNAIVNGLVLAEDGNKMSKRLKNYPEPTLVIDKYGADATRLFLINSPAVKAGDLRFSERGVEILFRQALIPLWNAYSFFVTYARIYNWIPVSSFKPKEALIDRWIVSKLHKLIQEVEVGMDRYELNLAINPIVAFVDELTNWYIRRSRSRFWADLDSSDRQDAFETLYYILLEFVKVIAPFTPFIAEAIYQNLNKSDIGSVHHCDFPIYQASLRDEGLERGMDFLQKVVSLGHSLRKDSKVKVRQPLSKVFIATEDSTLLAFLEEHQNLILEELNVKEAIFMSDESSFVSFAAKANFRVLGKKVGKWMKAATEVIDQLSLAEINRFLKDEQLLILVEGQEIMLTKEDMVIERKVKEQVLAGHIDCITVALDINLSEELIEEGLVRELKNKVNVIRKEISLQVTDRIIIKLTAQETLKKALNKHLDYFMHEVLAIEVIYEDLPFEPVDINGYSTIIEIKPV